MYTTYVVGVPAHTKHRSFVICEARRTVHVAELSIARVWPVDILERQIQKKWFWHTLRPVDKLDPSLFDQRRRIGMVDTEVRHTEALIWKARFEPIITSVVLFGVRIIVPAAWLAHIALFKSAGQFTHCLLSLRVRLSRRSPTPDQRRATQRDSRPLCECRQTRNLGSSPCVRRTLVPSEYTSP